MGDAPWHCTCRRQFARTQQLAPALVRSPGMQRCPCAHLCPPTPRPLPPQPTAPPPETRYDRAIVSKLAAASEAQALQRAPSTAESGVRMQRDRAAARGGAAKAACPLPRPPVLCGAQDTIAVGAAAAGDQCGPAATGGACAAGAASADDGAVLMSAGSLARALQAPAAPAAVEALASSEAERLAGLLRMAEDTTGEGATNP